MKSQRSSRLGLPPRKTWGTLIRAIIEWSVQFRLLVLVLSIGLVVYGYNKIQESEIDTYPEFQPVRVEVRAEALGLSAEEVAEFVTVPLEVDLLNTVPWIDVIRSESLPGLSSIEMIFEPGTDLLRARQVVQERLAEALIALPGVSTPPQMLQPTSSTNRVMMVGLSSQELSLIDLSVLARWNIRPKLLGVPGVANVSVWGQREQQLQVLVDPEILRDEDIPLVDVIRTTADALWSSPLSFVEASYPGTGGFVETPNQRLGVQHISPISTPEELSLVPLLNRPDLRLADVGEIVTDHQPLIGDAVLNNGEGLLLVIEKFPGTNTLEVTHDIEAALDALRPGLAGVVIDTDLYRPADYINRGLDNLAVGALIAGGLVLAVLALFLFDWRTLLVAASTIPLSLLAAALVLDRMGEGINGIVLAGLTVSLAIIIDDATAGAEAIRRRFALISEEDAPVSLVQTAIDSLVESRSPLFYVSLISALAALPLLFFEGVAGAFLPPFVIAYVTAIVVSMLVALLVTPAVAVLLLPGSTASRRDSPVIDILGRWYARLLGGVLHGRLVVYGVAGILVLVGLALTTQIKETTFLPTLQEHDLVVSLEAEPGTSGPAMTRIVGRLVEELELLTYVSDVGGHIGRAIGSDQVLDVDSAEVWVRLDSDANTVEAIAAIQSVVNGYPGLAGDVGNLPEARVEKLLSGTDKDITVRVYGTQIETLASEADAVLALMNRVDGVADAQIEFPDTQPTIRIRVDLARAEPYGLKPGDVRRTAATLLSGIGVGSLFEDQKVFEVVVWSTEETRSSVSSVENLLIRSATGEYVRLGDVADVIVEASPTKVRRESVSRYIDVTARADGRSISSIEAEIEDRLPSLQFPLEYHAELVKEKTLEGRLASINIAPFVLTAVIGIFLLLQAALVHWRLATISFLVLPTGLVGGLFALFIFEGGDLSIGSYVGFLAVLAISVRNGLALFRHYLQQQRGGHELSQDLIITGASLRLQPVLMTAAAVGLGMLPVAIAGQVAGYEIISPLAVVVIGGLISTTLLTLFVLPALYLQFGPRVLSQTIGEEFDA